MTLRLVKDGAPEPDAELVEIATQAALAIVENVRDGHGFWLLLDGEEPRATYVGDEVEMTALAEEVARHMKRRGLGLE